MSMINERLRYYGGSYTRLIRTDFITHDCILCGNTVRINPYKKRIMCELRCLECRGVKY